MKPSTVVLFTRIPPELAEALRKRAFEERRPKSDIVREALEQYEARRKGGNRP